jgi:hypothetical protein
VCSCISKKKPRENTLTNLTEHKILNIKESTLQRQNKRDNVQSCYFRIKYKQDKYTKNFRFIIGSNFIHNHPPNNSKNKEVSLLFK